MGKVHETIPVAPAPELLPSLREQLADIHALRPDAEQRGWTNEVERHGRVIVALAGHLRHGAGAVSR